MDTYDVDMHEQLIITVKAKAERQLFIDEAREIARPYAEARGERDGACWDFLHTERIRYREVDVYYSR